MGFPLAEILRIGAMGIGAAGAIVPGGALVGALLTGAANAMDKEDDPDTPAAVRKMKQKRRESWIKFCLALEKDIKDKLKKYPIESHGAVGRALKEAAGSDLRSVIRADIFETEDRVPEEQEVNLYAEAVSAKAREKL